MMRNGTVLATAPRGKRLIVNLTNRMVTRECFGDRAHVVLGVPDTIAKWQERLRRRSADSDNRQMARRHHGPNG